MARRPSTPSNPRARLATSGIRRRPAVCKPKAPASDSARLGRGHAAIRGTVVRIEGRYPHNVPVFTLEEIDILERNSRNLVTLYVGPATSIHRQITLGREISCLVEPGRLVRVE